MKRADCLRDFEYLSSRAGCLRDTRNPLGTGEMSVPNAPQLIFSIGYIKLANIRLKIAKIATLPMHSMVQVELQLTGDCRCLSEMRPVNRKKPNFLSEEAFELPARKTLRPGKGSTYRKMGDLLARGRAPVAVEVLPPLRFLP